MKDKEDDTYQLTGESNYLANARLAEKDCYISTTDKQGNETKLIPQDKEGIACGVLHRIISMKVLQSIPAKIATATGIIN